MCVVRRLSKVCMMKHFGMANSVILSGQRHVLALVNKSDGPPYAYYGTGAFVSLQATSEFVWDTYIIGILANKSK